MHSCCTTRTMKSSLHLILLLAVLWIVRQSSLNGEAEAEHNKWQADDKQTCSAEGTCPCIRRGDTPTLLELTQLNLASKQDPIRIKDRIGANFWPVGICLLNDNDGSTLNSIKRNNDEFGDKLTEIFRLWLEGKGQKDGAKLITSWSKLVECLNFAQLKALADEIKSVLCHYHSDRSRKKATITVDPEHNDKLEPTILDDIDLDVTYPSEVPSIMDEVQFKHVFSMITTICQINTEVSNNPFVESNVIKNASMHLYSIVSRLKAGKIRAGVVGLTKAGKSTTLNALLGNQYLPGSVQPQTAAEVSIVHTTDASGVLYGMTGERRDRLAIGYQNIHDKLVELNVATRKDSQNGYKKLILHAPLQFLMTNEVQGVQFELSDTPGLGEAAAEHLSLTSELAVRDMCAFVMIMKLDFLKTKAEANLLMKLSTHHPKLFTNLNRILILVNAYELSNKDKSKHNLQANEIQAYVSDYLKEPNVLGKAIPKENIIPFSALWGLRARLWSANPDELLKGSEARNLYNEAIIELDRAGYEVESLRGERSRENVHKVSLLLEEFSHITLVESNLTNMLYTHGATVLMESSVDDTLSIADDMLDEMPLMIEREYCSKKESLVQNARLILASYKSIVDKHVSVVRDLAHFIEASTGATISTLADSLEENINGLVNSKLYEILQATIEHEDKKHVQSKIISIKSAILSPAANRMRMEWIKVTDSIHKALSERVKIILSELKVELVSLFSDVTSQPGFIDEETIKHFNKIVTMTSERLVGLQDAAVGFTSSPDTSGLPLELTYQGQGSERVTDTALSERLIQGKRTKYNMKSDKVCMGRRYGFFGPKECVRITIAEPYDAATYSPDFGSIQSDFGEVIKGWINLFAAEVDNYRSKSSETVAKKLVSEVETALSPSIQQLKDDLDLKEDALEQSKLNVDFLESVTIKLNKAIRDLEGLIDEFNS